MTPLRDAKTNQISFFVGIQYEVSGPNPMSQSPASSTSLLSLTALSADRMGVVMGRGNSPNNGIEPNNEGNRFYRNTTYNPATGGYPDVNPHTHPHLPSQLRGSTNNHLGHINGGNNGGMEGSASTSYSMMTGLGQHQSFADDRSSLTLGSLPFHYHHIYVEIIYQSPNYSTTLLNHLIHPMFPSLLISGAMSTSGSTSCGYSSQTSSACDGSSEGNKY